MSARYDERSDGPEAQARILQTREAAVYAAGFAEAKRKAAEVCRTCAQDAQTMRDKARKKGKKELAAMYGDRAQAFFETELAIDALNLGVAV